MPRHLVKRDGYWRFVRRVPKEFLQLDRRRIVQQSTKVKVVDDPRAIRAVQIAERMNLALENYWLSLIDGDTGEAVAEYEASRNAARQMRIRPAEYDAQRTIAELLDRIEKLTGNRADDRASVLAVYDAAAKPAVTFQQAAERFIDSHRPAWSNICHADNGAAVHGFRSSFRDWGSEARSYPSELLEMALAHSVGSKVEKAYRRGDMLEKRHQLMEDWGRFCDSGQ